MKVKYTIVIEKELDPKWYPEGTDIVKYEQENTTASDALYNICDNDYINMIVEEIK